MGRNHSLIPPWKTSHKWRDLHRTLAYLITKNGREMKHACEAAQDIENRIGSLSDPMDDLCRQTCRMCPEICCFSAMVWADFRDVIFWHLTGQAIPLEQNMRTPDETCRYLGKKGCTLPRLSRPFVCTWYLCPTQVSRLKSTHKEAWNTMLHTLQSAKKKRNLMESAFISALL